MNGRQAIQGEGSLHVTAWAEGGKAVLAFRDSGPGFDTDIMDKLFEPFFTTKESGTGLGLPIVHSIITAHGGDVKLGNADGGGAVVTVLLPLAPEDSVGQPEEASPAASSQEERKAVSLQSLKTGDL